MYLGITAIHSYGWVKTINLGLALAFPLTPVFAWRWTHTREHWIISSMTSILKIVLWMFQKMCISEFNILFIIYFCLLIWKYFNPKWLTTIILIIFVSFRFTHVLFVVFTKYYLFQQYQHQHLWKNAENIIG
jgi:lysylphosphatidylglycerol synthetase-like protein (DUF2156 family)